MKDEVNGVGRSKRQLETQHKYEKNNYDQIALRFRKVDRIIPLLTLATEITGKSKNEYIKQSLLKQFELDGITLDKLPSSPVESQPEPKQPRRYMIYTITERFILDYDYEPEKYIAMFPTLKAAEKYVRDKLDRKPYPADWTYTIYGRYMEGDNQRDAWNKLKIIVKDELEVDKANGTETGGLNWLERINKNYPADYVDTIKGEGTGEDSIFDFDYDFSDIEEDDDNE